MRQFRVFTEKHPCTIKGQLLEKFNRKSGKRTEAHDCRGESRIFRT